MSIQFGGKITKELRQHYERSEHWKDGKFQNFEKTELGIDLKEVPKLIYGLFSEQSGREPNEDLAIIPLDKQALLKKDNSAKFIWYGHSALMLQMSNKTILIDPMLGPNAAPISPFPVKRFSQNTLALIEDFPEIDLLLLSHDHYDHLDYKSIQLLKKKTKRYWVALGTMRHLIKWGVEEHRITEFDWWEHKEMDGLKIHFTPTRHFSGRGLRDRSKSLWGGWVLDSGTERIWFSGDGGYGSHFKEVGQRLGPFDFAFMECGQYNKKWRPIHLFPDESVQAAIDAGAKRAMPVHWGGFKLSEHNWTEPVEQFIKSCEEQGMDYLVPRLGEVVDVNGIYNHNHWWRSML